MTGGQYSPTTYEGLYAQTAPYTAFEPSFNLCDLVMGAGAPYIARGTCAKPLILQKYIKEAIEKPGFSFVEARSICPALLGFYNKDTKPASHLKRMKANSIDIRKAEMMKANGETIGPEKIVTGVFRNEETEHFLDHFKRVNCKERKDPMSLFMTTLDVKVCDEE